MLFSQCCADNVSVSHKRVLTGQDFIVLIVQTAFLECCHCNCSSVLTSSQTDVCPAGGYDGYFKHSAAAAAAYAASSSGSLPLPRAMLAPLPSSTGGTDIGY